MDFCRIHSRLAAEGVELRILNIGMDTSTPTGKLMLNVVAAVAQFEREMMLERQREGVAKAKAEKRYKGRVPAARAKSEQVKSLGGPDIKKRHIALQLGMSERSVFRPSALRELSLLSRSALPRARYFAVTSLRHAVGFRRTWEVVRVVRWLEYRVEMT